MKNLYAIALMFVACLAGINAANAGTGDVHVLPSGGAKPKHGLKLTIDLRWVDGNGYRPARITLAPAAGTATRDRQVRVMLRFNGESTAGVTTLIDLPTGSTGVTKTIAIPQCSPFHSFQVMTSEGDRPLEDLCMPGMSIKGGGAQWSEAQPTIVWFDSDVPARVDRDLLTQSFKTSSKTAPKDYTLPDFRGVATVVWAEVAAGVDTALPAITDAELLTQIDDYARIELLPLAEAPTSWLQLSAIDLIFISYADLQRLSDAEPQRFEALRRWLTSGPMLCVYDAGENYGRLAELEKLLQLPPLPSAASHRYRGWTEPDPEKRLEPLSGYGATAMPTGPATMLDDEIPQRSADELRKRWAIPTTAPFIQRDAGMGLVVAMAEPNPFPGENHRWAWLLNSASHKRWKWLYRHGMSQNRMNNNFWNQLIAGVGTAPVLPFVLLTTLFAALIGPANYLFLKRRKRLYLLLVTVPAGAVVVTAGLFTYAVIIDGFGVRARIRSVTIVDQRLGQAVSWSRQSYYASIAPSQGLVFPTESAVFPLLYEPMQRNGELKPGGQINWSNRQELQSGFIGSRAMSQFLVINVANSDSKLTIQSQSGEPANVVNGLHTKLHYLLVSQRSTDAAAPPKLWSASNVAIDGAARLTPVNWLAASEQLRQYDSASPLAYPSGYDPNNHDTAYEWWFPDYRRWSRIDSNEREPEAATSLLEQQLLAMSGKHACPLAPGEYLAVCDRPSEVPLGVSRVREGASLHLIRGRW